MVRVAVLDRERCKPKDCSTECIKFCPPVRSRIEAVKFVEGESRPLIVEALCSGCGICVKKCPFQAVSIVNLPEEIEGECSHRYGANSFKLYRLPIPQKGMITGLIGRNSIGKTTALRILSGEIKPNLGRYDEPPEWGDIIKHYRGSLLQDHFDKIQKKILRVVHKPQYVDKIPSHVKGKVQAVLGKADDAGRLKRLVAELQLKEVLNRPLDVLSGGELQRVAVAATCCRDADVYLFDEPSSHLDVSQRLSVARTIRSLVKEEKTVVLTEHDLAMLDYLSDHIYALYGEPGVYGVVSHAHGVRVGINIYLDGFIPDENMRFRSWPIRFHVKPPKEEAEAKGWSIDWSHMGKSYKSFKLTVEPGKASQGEVVGIVGPNGIGKTTFIKLIAGMEKPDDGAEPAWKGLSVSYKPQYISGIYDGTVESLIKNIADVKIEGNFFEDKLAKPLGITKILDRNVKDLSGGELQCLAIVVCLAKKADIYLIDEPSAYLDVEERLTVAKAIREGVEQREAFAFVVEHDVVALDFIADRIMIFDGKPGLDGHAHSPVSLRDGMNLFLANMNLTFRRDPENGRPRVNKPQSKLDKMQKDLGEYYYAP